MKRAAAFGLSALLLPQPLLGQATPQDTASQSSRDQPAAPTASGTAGASATETTLPQVNVVGAAPLLGSGVDRSKVPAQNQVFTSQDLSLTGPSNLTGTLQEQAQGVYLGNQEGNPFQPSVFYHGFVATPIQGNPSGIAVYVNGARFNNAFGDTVNWDLIPDIAIDRINLEGANPVFGLNALGGALSVDLKNGFTYHGGELDVFGGSFGQVAGQFQYGQQSGNTAAYVAASGLHENGWRDYQQSGLKQFYGDLGWRSDRAELHVNIDLAQTSLNGPGSVPVELLNVDRRAQFTGPNSIDNNYVRLNINGNVAVSDTTSVQYVAYYDNLWTRVLNGNPSPLEACENGSPFLCEQNTAVVATTLGGTPIPLFLGRNGVYGSVAEQTTNSNGYGASVQVSNRSPVFGRPNQLVVGLSFDGADTTFSANTLLSGFDVPSRNAIPPFFTIDQADASIAPVRAGITNAYYGAYFTDTLDVTPRLSANVAGRFNAAEINIKDLTGPSSLTGNHY
ncbi:MAG: TonB-dependent receptor, partial [Acetobacteraceae bacterium]|nr:TonB-dependent receptor [Acetobacteraceae bacterium]